MKWQKIVAALFIGNALTAGTLHLKTRTIDTTDLPADYQAGAANHWRTGSSHYILQFRAPVSDADQSALTERGATVLGMVPDNAVMVLASDDFSTDGLDLEYAGRLRGEDKVSPGVGDYPDGSAFVVEFYPDVNPLDALQLLSQQNLAVLPHPNLAANHFLVTGMTQAVLSLQDWDEVDYIFPASDDLVSGEIVQLCAGDVATGGSGLAQNTTGQYVVVGHGWPKDSSGKATVGYYFSALTPKVAPQTVKAEIQRALTEWAKYAPLQFLERTSATAPQTVNVLFASGDHGDGFPFNSTILAHTFYPSNPEPIAGDMHLNADEPWHSGNNIDIYTVALHEAGHALGLGHSDQPGAVMYPYYRLGAQISSYDIAGIQAVYGAPAPAPVPAATVLTLNLAAPTTSTTAAAISLSGTTSNGTGQTAVTWQTDHKTSGQAATQNSGSSWSAAAVPLVTGSNTITVRATDSSHRIATRSVTITRTAASTSAPVAPASPTAPTSPTAPGPVLGAPSITISSPAMTIVQTNQSSITVTGTASAGTAKVTWQDGPAGTGNAAGTTNWSATVPLLTGTNNVILKAWDAAGNSGWRSLTVIRR